MANLNTKDIHFTSIGVDTGTTWTGPFTIKLSLSPRDVLNLDKLYRDYLGNTNGSPPSEVAMYYAYMLSQLAVRLTKFPDWWKDSQSGLNLKDSNTLEDLWKIVEPEVLAYQQALSDKAEAAKATIRETVTKEEKETGLL